MRTFIACRSVEFISAAENTGDLSFFVHGDFFVLFISSMVVLCLPSRRRVPLARMRTYAIPFGNTF
jgi:hypothetical protein